jgi:broad specificity phosphatase PhoE
VVPLPRVAAAEKFRVGRSRRRTYGFFTLAGRVSCTTAAQRAILMGTPLVALFIRHADTNATGTQLSGRTPDVHLSDRGRLELFRLQDQLSQIPIDAVYTSPLVRARETAAPIAVDHGLSVDIEDDLNEVDFGNWTGQTFDALSTDAQWRLFNTHRSSTAVPNGERAPDVQRRIVFLLTRLAGRHRSGIIALVSHAEIIRCAVLWYAGRSLDDFQQFTIDTASVTAIQMTDTPRVLFVNATDHCDLDPLRATHSRVT